MLEQCKISGFGDEIDKDIEKQITLLNQLGQSYIEFRSGDGKNIVEYSIDEAKTLKNRLEEANIKVSAIGSPIGKIGITEEFDPHFNTFQHVVELAKILDTKYIRMFSFFIPMGEEAEKYEEEVMTRIEQFVSYAKEQNVILLHENEKDIYGDNAERCKKLMDRFYGEHFQMTFDFANFVQCNVDTIEAYQLLKTYISYIHIKDALTPSHEVVPAGMGDGNLKEILTDLDRSGYQGFLSLEPHLSHFVGFETLELEGSLPSNTKHLFELLKGQEMTENQTLSPYEIAFYSLKDILQ